MGAIAYTTLGALAAVLFYGAGYLVLSGLFDILTIGSGDQFAVGTFLEEVSPYVWANTGIGLCIGLSIIGAGWYVISAYRLGASLSQAHLFSALVCALLVSRPRT